MAAANDPKAAPAPVVASKTRRYEMTFADGKKATVLDMAGEPQDVAMRGITEMFHAGYVTAVVPA